MAHEGFGAALFDDLHGARPRVEIIGNSRVVVENHRGIQEYDDGLLRIKCCGCEVRITGAGFRPPAPQEMFQQMCWFFADMPRQREKLNAIEWAAWTHAEFVRIHPFPDGNGRTARMLMNLQLLTEGFQPISIAKEERLAYYEALEAYAVRGELAPFAEMVAALEEARLDEYLAAFAGA